MGFKSPPRRVSVTLVVTTWPQGWFANRAGQHSHGLSGGRSRIGTFNNHTRFRRGGSRTAPTRAGKWPATGAISYPWDFERNIRHNFPIGSKSASVPLDPGPQHARLLTENCDRVDSHTSKQYAADSRRGKAAGARRRGKCQGLICKRLG